MFCFHYLQYVKIEELAKDIKLRPIVIQLLLPGSPKAIIGELSESEYQRDAGEAIS